MACTVCMQVSRRDIEQISTWLVEGLPPENIAIKLGIPFDTLMYHIENCLEKDAKSSKNEQLELEYQRLIDAVDVARNAYIADPRNPHAQAYSMLLTQLRVLSFEIQRLENPDKVVEEVSAKILAPLVSKMVSTITEELRRAREELIKQLGTEATKPVSSIIVDTLSRTGPLLKMDQTEAVGKLQKYFGVKAQETTKQHRDKYQTIQ